MKNITISKIFLILIPISIFMIYMIVNYIAPPMPKNISIATGAKDGMYYHYATIYKKLLKKDGIDLEIVPTAGSVEALKLLSDKKVTFAFMQGGTAKDLNSSNIESLASIYPEPLWVFYPKLNTLNSLSELNGKKIAIGKKGSELTQSQKNY